MKQIIYILTFLILASCGQSNSKQTSVTVSDTTSTNSSQSDTLELKETDYGQTTKLTVSVVENYVNSIDKMKAKNKLEKIFYPNMSGCGGALYGYYLDKKLVLIDATYQAELGFSSKTIYIDQDNFVKIIYREHFAEWGKYEQKYPSDKYEFDASKMTYTDTLYTISLTNPTIFKKQAGKMTISTEINQPLINKLVNCGQEMKRELNEVTKDKKLNY
jgi:hypothetical protein